MASTLRLERLTTKDVRLDLRCRSCGGALALREKTILGPGEYTSTEYAYGCLMCVWVAPYCGTVSEAEKRARPDRLPYALVLGIKDPGTCPDVMLGVLHHIKEAFGGVRVRLNWVSALNILDRWEQNRKDDGGSHWWLKGSRTDPDVG